MRRYTALFFIALAIGFASAVACEDEKMPNFEGSNPEKVNFEPNVTKYDPVRHAQRLLKAINYHIKNLNDPDSDVRLSSCEMLGYLRHELAIAPLIDMLRPERKEPSAVKLVAAGALNKITQQHFGTDYKAWLEWWIRKRFDFELPPEMKAIPKQ